MPEDKFEDIDVLLERLVMLEKIHEGLNQLENGQGVSLKALQKDMGKWDN